MDIDNKIEKFIKAHHVLTLATATLNGEPYCCNCFYAYDKESAAFISIVLETRTVGKIQGLQITGHIKTAKDSDKTLYIKRFPYTAIADLTLWRLEADFMKLTDNTLGFGKKLIWQRQE